MAWEMVTKKETTKRCLKHLKSIVKEIENGRRTIIILTEEMEMLPHEFGELHYIESRYTGINFINFTTEKVTDESS